MENYSYPIIPGRELEGFEGISNYSASTNSPPDNLVGGTSNSESESSAQRENPHTDNLNDLGTPPIARPRTEMNTSGSFYHGHQDIVNSIHYNFDGSRIVTASADHRLKVWETKDEEWQVVDTWRGHDAEVLDVSSPHNSLIPHTADHNLS